jgi:hypothetical protein
MIRGCVVVTLVCSAHAMWSDSTFVRTFITCLADLQSSPGTPLAETQTTCVSDACSTILNLVTHLRDASGLPGCAMDICEALAEGCDSIRSRRMNTDAGSLMLKVMAFTPLAFLPAIVCVYVYVCVCVCSGLCGDARILCMFHSLIHSTGD